MRERRTETRIDVDVAAVMTPLAAVTTRVQGQIVNLSMHGIKVRVKEKFSAQPRYGDVYRVLSGRDLMLCEVCHCRAEAQSAEIGFRIVSWRDEGELNHLAAKKHTA